MGYGNVQFKEFMDTFFLEKTKMTWQTVTVTDMITATTWVTVNPALPTPSSSSTPRMDNVSWKMWIYLVAYVLAFRAVRAHESCEDWPTLLDYKYYTSTDYLLELENYDPNLPGCANFFNETTICFDYTRPADYDFEGRQVRYVERNHFVRAAECEAIDNTWWHLHDISHREASTGGSIEYCHKDEQPETTVYIVDTFVDVEHREFEGRARLGKEIVPGTTSSLHGTHVAGLVGGKRSGVNTRAKLVSVVVLNDNGVGSWAEIIRGLEWIAQQQDKGIINMSIAGARSQIVNNVIRKMVREGYKIVVAAGNDAQDACNASPASEPSAVTVGAVGRQNQWAAFSNFGPCVDILAPGDTIASALPNNKFGFMSGTSMASPLVAGIWSLYPKWNSKRVVSSGVMRTIGGLPPRTTPRHAFNLGQRSLREFFSQNDIELQ